MSDDTCRYPGCEKETRERGEQEYPDSDKEYTVDAFGAKFCSLEHELKYDHIRADARDAKRAAEEEREERRL